MRTKLKTQNENQGERYKNKNPYHFNRLAKFQYVRDSYSFIQLLFGNLIHSAQKTGPETGCNINRLLEMF